MYSDYYLPLYGLVCILLEVHTYSYTKCMIYYGMFYYDIVSYISCKGMANHPIATVLSHTCLYSIKPFMYITH